MDIKEELRKHGLDEIGYERICKDIDDKKLGVNDPDWKDICMEHGVNLNKDTVRKANETIFGGFFRSQYEKHKKVDGNSSDILNEIKEATLEMEKERKKIQAVNIERHRNVRQDGRFELFYDTYYEKVDTYPIPEFKELQLQDGEKEHLLEIADIHAGAQFVSQNNIYNFDECERRFEVLLNKTIKYVQEKSVSKLKIMELGDTVQGLLRISDVKLNETTVVDSVIRISKILASFLNQLSGHCEIEYMHVQSSNHSQIRPLGTKANEMASEDLEKIIVNYIHDVLENNVRVLVHTQTSSDRIMFKIFDFECVALHGQQIKSVKNAIKDLSMLHRRFFDYVFLAHYHGGQTYMVGESDVQCEVIVCPSFIGSDPYSDSLMLGSKSMCQIYEFDEYEGHVGTVNLKLN